MKKRFLTPLSAAVALAFAVNAGNCPAAYCANPPDVSESALKDGATGSDYLAVGLKQLAAGDLDEAARCLERALPMVEKFSPEYEAVLENLCNIYMEKGDNANANRLLGLMDEHNRNELAKECGTPECHLERAEYFIAVGDAASAKDEYMAAFGMSLTNSQKAEICYKFARFLTSQNDYARAAEYYALSADANEADAGVSKVSVAARRLAGMCYFIGKEFEKSIESHRKVIEAVDANGYEEKWKASSLEELGKVYRAKKDYGNAKKSYQALIAHLEASGRESEADYAKAFERLASVEKFSKEYDEAIADYGKAIELYTLLGMHDEAAQAEGDLRQAMMYSGREPVAQTDNGGVASAQREAKLREILKSSMDVLEQGGDYLGPLSKARTLATVAGCYGQLGDYGKAVEYYSYYLSAVRGGLMEDFLLKSPKERALTWQRELTNINQMGSLMSDVPTKCPAELGRLSKLIYEGQLLAKGILLSSEVEFEKILNRYGTEEMRKDYEHIKENLAKIEEMRQKRGATEEILELTRATDVMQLSLSRQSATKGIFTDFLKYEAKDVVASLGDDEAAVEFVTLSTGVVPRSNMVAAVVVSKECREGVAVPVGTVGQINEMIADAQKFSKDEYGAAVWGNILRVTAGKKRIYFAPDGVLNNIGIEYLSLDGRPVSEQMDLCRVSSTRELCREHKSSVIRRAALFGDIDYSGEVAELTGADREADGELYAPLAHTGREIAGIEKSLKSKFKKCVVRPYSGASATKRTFLSEATEGVNLLHIATHGAFLAGAKATESDAMANSILAFAGANLFDEEADNQGVVNANEIAGMALHDCDLVVLSACESGVGKLGDDGVFGLQRGFKNAGAKTLLVSLNKVADEATADMMIAFYNHYLTDGKPKREALREAQAEIRAKYPGQNTWASFVMIDSF